MTQSILIIIIAFGLLSNAASQSFMTNTVERCELKPSIRGKLGSVAEIFSHAFNVRICAEDATFQEELSMTFTKSTLEHALGVVMENTTNHMWRYDDNTGSIYIHPVTNAVSTMKIGPVAVTNAPLISLFQINDIGFGNLKMNLRGADVKERIGNFSWLYTKISLEFEEAYVREVLDMICMQLPYKLWCILANEHEGQMRYTVFFFYQPPQRSAFHDYFKQ